MRMKIKETSQNPSRGTKPPPAPRPRTNFNYDSLTYDELARMASTDPGAQRFIFANAQRIIEDCDDRAEYLAKEGEYDPAGCYDNGWQQALKDLADKYAEDLLTFIENPVIDGELEILLSAIRADMLGEKENGK